MFNLRKHLLIVLTALLLVAQARALELEPGPGDLFCRVVDVGAGQCLVIKIPGDEGDDFYIVYDAGNFVDNGASAFKAIEELIPQDEGIDLLVLSHTDADHVAAVPEIVEAYIIETILRTGQEREGPATITLRDTRKAIRRAVDEDDTLDLNLNEIVFPPGATFRFGEALVTMISGFGAVPADWDTKNRSERHNATSIVIRIVFKGKSLLICGDAVGRHNGDDPDEDPIATERFILEQTGAIPIDSDILIAPHHGADNGSSSKFINAVSPDWVIFSAGHKHEHPRAVTAARYLSHELDQTIQRDHILRTDRGDNEAGDEWKPEPPGTEPDPRGDDDIDIVIRANGSIAVAYRNN